MVKLSSMSGYGILLHPHAEATDVIINMAGKYKTSFPLFDTKGNFGDNFGNPASAPRYLECRLNDVARKLYFSQIAQAPMENFEVEEEPLYLPTLFPLALLQGCFSVGQGTPNPLIPELDYEDLKKYVINFIKTGKTTVDKNNFVRLVDYDKVRNDKDKDDSICRLLNTGKGSIYFSPKVELKDNTIRISNLYILASFSSLIDRFKEDIQADKIDIRDESSTERVWVIEKVKNKCFDMEECAKIVRNKFTYKENFCMYFHDDEGKVKPYSLGEIISIAYEKYKEATVKSLKSILESKNVDLAVLNCLAEMAEHTDIVVDNKISDELKVDKLWNAMTQTHTKEIIKKCMQKPISYLKKDNKAITKIKTEISNTTKDIKNVSDYIISSIP